MYDPLIIFMFGCAYWPVCAIIHLRSIHKELFQFSTFNFYAAGWNLLLQARHYDRVSIDPDLAHFVCPVWSQQMIPEVLTSWSGRREQI